MTCGNIDTLREHRLSVSQLLQDLGSTSKSITRLTNAAVDNEFVDLKTAHGVFELVLSHFYKFSRNCTRPLQSY